MPHVNQLIDKYGSQGFYVVGVTGEPEDKTLEYIATTKSKAIVAYEPKELPSMAAYGFTGFPSAALVGPDGKVVWTGHPAGLTDKIVEKALVGVKAGPLSDALMVDAELPKKYAAIEKLLGGGKLGEADKALTAAIAAPGLTDADRTALTAAQKQLQALAADEMKKADAAAGEKRHFDAQVIWKRLSTQFIGTETAKSADTNLAEAAKDPVVKREVEAGARIADALKLFAAGKTAPAISALSSILEGPLKDTAEAQRAKQLLDQWKAKKPG